MAAKFDKYLNLSWEISPQMVELLTFPLAYLARQVAELAN